MPALLPHGNHRSGPRPQLTSRPATVAHCAATVTGPATHARCTHCHQTAKAQCPSTSCSLQELRLLAAAPSPPSWTLFIPQLVHATRIHPQSICEHAAQAAYPAHTRTPTGAELPQTCSKMGTGASTSLQQHQARRTHCPRRPRR